MSVLKMQYQQHQIIKRLEKTLKKYQNLSLWKDIEFPSHSKDQKEFEQNSKTIALNILSIKHNTKQIRQAYISKYKYRRDNQVILLIITNNSKHSDGVKDWHYLAVKKLVQIAQRNNIKSCWRFLLFKLFSSIQNKKKLEKHNNSWFESYK